MMNIQKMMKQAQEMQTRMQEMQAEMETAEEEGSSGGGAVKAVMNGKGRAVKISIDASLLKADEKEMLEDLLVAAINDARNKMDTAYSAKMQSVTAGLQLPPGMKLPF